MMDDCPVEHAFTTAPRGGLPHSALSVWLRCHSQPQRSVFLSGLLSPTRDFARTPRIR